MNNFNNPLLQEENLQSNDQSRVIWFTAPRAVLVILLIVLGLYFVYSKYSAETTVVEDDLLNVPTEDVKDNLDQNASADTDNLAKITADRWLAVPVKLTDIYFSYQDNYFTAERQVIGYTKEGKKIVMLNTPQEMGSSVDFLIEESETQYKLVVSGPYPFITEDVSFSTKKDGPASSTIIVDNGSYIEGVSGPDVIEFNGVKARLYSSGPSLFEDLKKNSASKKIADTKWGALYELQEKNITSDKFMKYKYVLDLPSIMSVEYLVQAVDILSDDTTLDINFNSEVTGNLKETGLATGIIRGGCGSSGYSVVNISEGNLLKIGTSKSGKNVYRVLSSEKEIFDIAYKAYADSRAYQEQELLSRAKFDNDVFIIVVKNDLGYYENYVSGNFSILAECGKPVIYLYPEKETAVSVGVGADVTVSVPEYNAGWQVIAKPNGDLKVGDKTYGSLFWEGIGHGQYPEINFGRVIETKNFISEVRSDLSKFGLNEKEISEFVDFWKNHIPVNKYTRISWLDTKQMNKLAPLSITPRPQTAIRVFLDFAGQDTNDENSYAHQEIVSTSRKGFTVVEWGGLLIK